MTQNPTPIEAMKAAPGVFELRDLIIQALRDYLTVGPDGQIQGHGEAAEEVILRVGAAVAR